MSETSEQSHTIPITVAPHLQVCPPLIVRLPAGISDTPSDPFKFEVRESVKTRKERTIKGSNSYIQLQADNFSDEAQTTAVGSQFASVFFLRLLCLISLCRYAFLKYSKSRQTLSLHLVPHIYSLTHSVLPEHRASAKNEYPQDVDRVHSETSPADYVKVYAELTQAFGSKMRRTQQTRRDTYAITSGRTDKTATRTTLTDLVSEADVKAYGIDSTKEPKPGQPDNAHIPPPHLDATTSADVYPLNERLFFSCFFLTSSSFEPCLFLIPYMCF